MNILKNTAVLISGIATVSLFVVWVTNYHLTDSRMPIVFNTAFATGSFVVICYGALLYLLQKDKPETKLMGIEISQGSMILKYWSFIALYLVFLLEVIHQSRRIYDNEAELIVICVFNLAYLVIAAVLANWKGTQLSRKLFFGLGIVFMVLYVIFGNMTVRQVRDDVFAGSGMELYYQLHYCMPVFFVILAFVMYQMLIKFSGEIKHQHRFILFASVFGLYLVCAEMDHFVVYQLADTPGEQSVFLRHTQIAGYTIVWGIYSFLVMILGMRKKARAIRVFALLAFSITLVKLFAFDIRNISEAGKIIAFISLGVMLLVVSFLYQKLKRMIVDGEVRE